MADLLFASLDGCPTAIWSYGHCRFHANGRFVTLERVDGLVGSKDQDAVIYVQTEHELDLFVSRRLKGACVIHTPVDRFCGVIAAGGDQADAASVGNMAGHQRMLAHSHQGASQPQVLSPQLHLTGLSRTGTR